MGLYGLPTKQSPDPWSRWEDAYYGGTKIEAASNIVFSNGLLDPWSAAGVYGHDGGDLTPTLEAVVLDQGAHHLDLMFTVEGAPECFAEARAREEASIAKWISEARETSTRRRKQREAKLAQL